MWPLGFTNRERAGETNALLGTSGGADHNLNTTVVSLPTSERTTDERCHTTKTRYLYVSILPCNITFQHHVQYCSYHVQYYFTLLLLNTIDNLHCLLTKCLAYFFLLFSSLYIYYSIVSILMLLVFLSNLWQNNFLRDE